MIHYLLLPYNNFDQLELLVNKIKTKNSKVYIHVEKDVKNFPKLKNAYYIENRQHCPWWWTWILKAELIWLKEIYKYMKKWDHVVFMSGQCFPIKPIEYIERYIDWLNNKSAIWYLSDKKYEWWVNKYRFYDTNFHTPSFINSLLIKLLSKFKKFDTDIKVPIINVIFSVIVSFILPKRKYIIDNYELYKWQNRMVLSQEHIHYLIEFLGTDKWKKFLKKYEYTLIPNETFFQTLLVNSKKEEIIRIWLWHFSRGEKKSSPNFLSMSDLDDIKKSDRLFARKFDINRDREIIEYLNAL